MPTRPPFPFATLPAPDEDHSRGEPQQTVSVVADEQYAPLHSDPAAVLDHRADPTRQHLYTTRQESTIATLLQRLGLPRLRPRARRHRLTPETIVAMLRHALGELRHELPKNVQADVQPEDEQFALATIERERTPENPSRAARSTAAGIAWERILIALARHLAIEHHDILRATPQRLPDLLLAKRLPGAAVQPRSVRSRRYRFCDD